MTTIRRISATPNFSSGGVSTASADCGGPPLYGPLKCVTDPGVPKSVGGRCADSEVSSSNIEPSLATVATRTSLLSQGGGVRRPGSVRAAAARLLWIESEVPIDGLAFRDRRRSVLLDDGCGLQHFLLERRQEVVLALFDCVERDEILLAETTRSYDEPLGLQIDRLWYDVDDFADLLACGIDQN